jgi:hypothetical protein
LALTHVRFQQEWIQHNPEGKPVKAIVYQNFGSPDILRFEEIDKPTPADNEVLIKIRAASVNPLDWKLMKGGPFILRLLLGLGKSKIKRSGVDVPGSLPTCPLTVANSTLAIPSHVHQWRGSVDRSSSKWFVGNLEVSRSTR